jgi:hypothetical protein
MKFDLCTSQMPLRCHGTANQLITCIVYIHVRKKRTSEFPTWTYYVMNQVQHIPYIKQLQWWVSEVKCRGRMVVMADRLDITITNSRF